MSNTVTAIADGASESIHAESHLISRPPWIASITAETWGASTAAALEYSVDGSTRWTTLTTTDGAVSMTENGGIHVPSNLHYRLNVTLLTGSTGLQLTLLET